MWAGPTGRPPGHISRFSFKRNVMEPVVAGIILAAFGAALVIVCVVLVRRWNRENRVKYPERFSGSHRFFEINRRPRR